MNQIDVWDAPAYMAAHAVFDKRYPEVSIETPALEANRERIATELIEWVNEWR